MENTMKVKYYICVFPASIFLPLLLFPCPASPFSVSLSPQSFSNVSSSPFLFFRRFFFFFFILISSFLFDLIPSYFLSSSSSPL